MGGFFSKLFGGKKKLDGEVVEIIEETIQGGTYK